MIIDDVMDYLSENRENLKSILQASNLKERDKSIIIARLCGYTYKKIGTLFGISGSRVRAILMKATRILYHDCFPPEINKDDIRNLRMSIRSTNALRLSGINLISELIQKKDSDLLSIRNLGVKSLKEIHQKTREYFKDKKGGVFNSPLFETKQG